MPTENKQPDINELKKNSTVNPADTYNEKRTSFKDTIRGKVNDVKKSVNDKVQKGKDWVNNQVEEAKQIGNNVKEGAKKAVNTVKEGLSKMDEQQRRNAASADFMHADPDTKADVENETEAGKKIVDAAVQDIDEKKLGEDSNTAQTIATERADTTVKPAETSTPAAPTTPDLSDDNMSELEINENDADSQAQALQAAEDVGVNPNSTPQDAQVQVQDIIKQLQESGLMTIKDGKVSFAKLQPTTKGTIAKLLTGLSIAATIATGGALPPLNFMKITGADKDEELQMQQYQKFMDNITSKYGDLIAKGSQASLGSDTNSAMGKSEYQTSGQEAAVKGQTEASKELAKSENEFAKDFAAYKSQLDDDSYALQRQIDLENELKTMIQAHANQKDLARYLADIDIMKEPQKLAYMYRDPQIRQVLQDGKFRDELARMTKAQGGTTRADDVWNKIDKTANVAGNVVDTVMNVATGGLSGAATK